MNRYRRQSILPEVGETGQRRLAAARILVVGAGGLGCPALQYLAGAGAGQIDIVDADHVALSNLHRQTLFREDQIGQFKAEAAQAALEALNSDCRVNAVVASLTAGNARDFVENADIVLDCADSFAVSYILSDTCHALKVPLISASALGMEGYVGGFCGNAPSLRAIFPDLPARAATCATAGVLGPVVGVLGAMQAQMALAQILDIEPSPMGQLVNLDLGTFRFGGFRFDNAPEPAQPVLAFMEAAGIQPQDFVVELRSGEEAPLPVTPQSLRCSVQDFAHLRPTPQSGQRAVLVCRSGVRSWAAAQELKSYWTGEIALIAMGDTPEFERPIP